MATTEQILEAVGEASPEEALAAALATAARLPGTARSTDLERLSAATAYRTKEGDTLDSIAHRRYGSVSAMPHILAANPELARSGPRLPAGTLVALPEIEIDVERPAPTVQLWD